MRRLTVFIVLLVLCLLLAIWAPWNSFNLNIASIFGIKQAVEVSGLQVNSLSGTLDVYVDGNKVGQSLSGNEPFIKENLTPGEHLISLVKVSDIENAYWKYSKVITFYKGTTVVASFNLGPEDEFSEGHIIYATENPNPQNKNNLTVSVNVDGASLTMDSNSEIPFNGSSLAVELSLDQQHIIRIHKSGYEDLQFTILPSSQDDRNKLKGLNLNIDAHLMLQPVNIETK